MVILKRGALEFKEFIELVLAGAGIIIVGLLFYTLISPSFDKVDKSSAAYFDILDEQLAAAESNGVGKMLSLTKDDDVSYYIVYFGEKDYAEGFVLKKRVGENSICVCSDEDDAKKCNYCRNLDVSATMNGDVLDYFVINIESQPTIKFSEGHYDFVVK
ncbi:MAG: hypothetical protein ABIF88_01735 [archaeon]